MNRDPLLELRGVPGLKNSEDVGYVTFGKDYHAVCNQPKLKVGITSFVSSSLQQVGHCGFDNLAHSTLPGLFSLSYQMLQSLYAFTHALPCLRIPESP